jgi:hypothetical protein
MELEITEDEAARLENPHAHYGLEVYFEKNFALLRDRRKLLDEIARLNVQACHLMAQAAGETRVETEGPFPERRFAVCITTGGDMLEDALSLAREYVADAAGGLRGAATGGFSRSGILKVIERPSVGREGLQDQQDATNAYARAGEPTIPLEELRAELRDSNGTL